MLNKTVLDLGDKNMSLFGEYAKFYDYYYKYKNYEGEVNYLLTLANKYGVKEPKLILEIGCGTGLHLVHLAKKGIDITGFYISKEMISIAEKKIKEENITNASVKLANATNYRDGRKYDIVISMFAAMGFIVENDDFIAAVKTAREHLGEHGLFIFDCWFGPAVMKIFPSVRVNEFTVNESKAIRIVEPITVDLIREVVETKNTVIQLKDDSIVKHIVEFHQIRFFFTQELIMILNQCGFELVCICPFMDYSRNVEIDDWNISVVGKAI